jgi:hypothetical protein
MGTWPRDGASLLPNNQADQGQTRLLHSREDSSGATHDNRLQSGVDTVSRLFRSLPAYSFDIKPSQQTNPRWSFLDRRPETSIEIELEIEI